MIVEAEGHLQVQPHKLGHVSMGVAVLGTEHSSNGVDLLEVTGDGHLLVELRRLGEIGRLLEVADCEHVGPSLTGSRDDLRSVDFDKTLTVQFCAESVTHSSLYLVDGLIRGSPQVQHAKMFPESVKKELHESNQILPVVETSVQIDGSQPTPRFLRPGSILYLQRHTWLRLGDYPQLADAQLHVTLGAALYRLIHAGHHTLHVDDRLLNR